MLDKENPPKIPIRGEIPHIFPLGFKQRNPIPLTHGLNFTIDTQEFSKNKMKYPMFRKIVLCYLYSLWKVVKNKVIKFDVTIE